MKTSSVIALSSFLAIVSATPLAKRVLVIETKTEEVTQTIDTTTTIWVEPSAATSVAAQQAYQQPAAQPAVQPAAKAKHGHVHQYLHTHAAAAAISSPPQQAAYVPPPEPTTSSTPAPAPVAPAQPTTSTAAPYVAPAPVAPAPVAPVVQPKVAAPVVQQAPKAPDSSSGGSSSGGSGGACGTVGGSCSGDITYYDAGLGACGWTNNGASEDVFALAHGMMGEQSNGNPFCGRMATIKVPGKAPVTAKLVDKCMGCEGQSIDLSHHLFDQLCDEVTGRLHNVEWSFTS